MIYQLSESNSSDVKLPSPSPLPSISLHNSENPLKADYEQGRRGGQLQCKV